MHFLRWKRSSSIYFVCDSDCDWGIEFWKGIFQVFWRGKMSKKIFLNGTLLSDNRRVAYTHTSNYINWRHVRCSCNINIVHASNVYTTKVQVIHAGIKLYMCVIIKFDTQVQLITRRYTYRRYKKYTHFHLLVHAWFWILHACTVHVHANKSTRTRKSVLGFTWVVL